MASTDTSKDPVNFQSPKYWFRMTKFSHTSVFTVKLFKFSNLSFPPYFFHDVIYSRIWYNYIVLVY